MDPKDIERAFYEARAKRLGLGLLVTIGLFLLILVIVYATGG